ncbi:MAG TPA: YciI family protein [Opitutaceae bacterium]|nr:YciI family protein [Opitutaceae bacterium]
MQYLLMVYMDEKRWAEVPVDERNRVHAACGVWHDDLVRSGHTRGAFGLQPPATATTLRKKNGQVIVTDGPFAETKEVLGGFEVVECKDLDEALAIAKRFPALDGGLTVEVRPCVAGGQCKD